MKWALHFLLLGLAVFAWIAFINKGKEIEGMEAELQLVMDEGDLDGEAHFMENEVSEQKGMRILTGVLMTFLTAGVVGILVAVYILPYFAQRVTHAVYDSGEMLEKDTMREAHSLIAQGEYEAAIKSLQKAAAEDPFNRVPWIEMAKIQREHYEDPAAAIETLRQALEGQEWEVDDATFFLFRIADLYDDDMNDRETARAIIQQVIDEFPETRHSANATHKLRNWDEEDESAKRRAEEEAFLAQKRAAEEPDADADSSNG